MNTRTAVVAGAAVMLVVLLSPQILLARPLESKRMERAKDMIADEQWVRAIDELKAAADDQKEPNRDEALFWLAHSQNQARDAAAAVETIRRLEREFPSSRWVKPARSLRIEIAQRLRRNDVLWYTAVPPPPPVPAAAPSPSPARVVPPVPPAPPTPRPAPVAAPASTPPVPTPALPPKPAAAPRPPLPPPAWIPEGYLPDMDMRIQALASLIRTDAAKVIPMLREIALESGSAEEARRALVRPRTVGPPRSAHDGHRSGENRS